MIGVDDGFDVPIRAAAASGEARASQENALMAPRLPCGASPRSLDEGCAVSMIAACQTHDDDSLLDAMDRLILPEGHAEVIRATPFFAGTLAGTGQILIPVPGAPIRQSTARPCRRQFH